MKKQVLVIAGVLAAATAGLAYAQGAGQQMRPRQMRGPSAAMLKQELGLTDDQVAQLQKFHTDQRKAQIRRRADSQLAQLALHEALQAPTPDPKVIQARIKELADLHAAGLQARVDGQLLMKKVLTPEQQKKMQQLREQHGRMGMGPGMGEGRGMGPGMRQRRGPGAGPGAGGPGPGDDGERPQPIGQ